MVMYTVNDAALYYTINSAATVTKIFTQVSSSGETAYLFTSTNIYNATMFAVQEAGGAWLGPLFFGRTTIGPDGKVGFVPDAQIEGSVGSVSVDAFSVDYITDHGSSAGLREALFAGDDTLIDNRYGGPMAGEAGNDLIVGSVIGGSDALDGGAGDDVIHAVTGIDHTGFTLVYGGKGADFIFMSDAYVVAIGGASADTFFYSTRPGAFDPVDEVTDFERKDRFQLDPAGFGEIASGVTKANFVRGPAAKDADDFLIFDQGRLLYDNDGSGPRNPHLIANLSPDAPLTWKSFAVSDVVPDAGDLGMTTPFAHRESHAWAVHATGVLP